MAFPDVASTTKGNRTSNADETSIAKPASAVDGQLALVFLGIDDNDNLGTTSTPGWSRSSIFSGSSDRRMIFWGYVGPSLSWPLVVSHDSEQSAWGVLCIDGAYGSPIFSNQGTGDSASPNSPNLTPPGGAQDFLWFSLYGGEKGPGASAAPSGFSGLDSSSAGTAVTGTSISWAWRKLNAASLDPGAFSTSVDDDWSAVTIAIAPVPTVTVEKNIYVGSIQLDGIDDLVITDGSGVPTTVSAVYITDGTGTPTKVYG